MTLLVAFITHALTASPVPEPLTPAPTFSPSFLVVAEPSFDSRLLELRLLSGMTPLPRGGDIDLIYTSLGVSAALGKELAVSGQIQSRALLGDPLASMPDRV